MTEPTQGKGTVAIGSGAVTSPHVSLALGGMYAGGYTSSDGGKTWNRNVYRYERSRLALAAHRFARRLDRWASADLNAGKPGTPRPWAES